MPRKINQRLADRMIRRHIFTQRLSNEQARKVLAMWQKFRPTLLGKLTELLEGKKSMSNKALTTLLTQIDKTVKTELRDEFKVLAEGLAEFADTEAEYLTDTLTAALQPALSVPAVEVVGVVTGAQIAATAMKNPFQGNTLMQWPDSLSEWTRTQISNQVRAGFIQGKPTMQIIADVKRALGGRSAQAISSVVKSAVNHYAATARELMVKANDDILDGRQWLSTLDTHTSTLCQLRDRLFYPVDVTPETKGKRDGKMVAGSQYGAGPGKLHYCCRSTETWKVKGMEDWPSGKRPALKAEAGKLLSEQVSAKTDFFSWVQRQPRHILEELYGVQRADQILRGVKVPTMFNDAGELMTIQQLKNKGLWSD